MPSFATLPSLSRLIITGRDRARYLHNFCTNDVKALPAGKAVEAFFCDVKARIIAHGFVLALEDRHECWMLGGDEAALLKHLNRYIITEDVQIRSATETTASCVAIDKDSIVSLLASTPGVTMDSAESLHCADVEMSQVDDEAERSVALFVTWADTSMLWRVGKIPSVADADQSFFERLRIRERFPIIHRDMSTDNMAPEAERNSSAISYVKGCYLGQEPIARLDAMGHVNRALRCVKSTASPEQFLQASVLTADNNIVGTVTSTVSDNPGSIGLAILRSNASQSPLHCVVNDQDIEVTIES